MQQLEILCRHTVSVGVAQVKVKSRRLQKNGKSHPCLDFTELARTWQYSVRGTCTLVVPTNPIPGHPELPFVAQVDRHTGVCVYGNITRVDAPCGGYLQSRHVSLDLSSPW